MSKRWFRVHKFWGWYPVTWEAWLVVISMAISIGGVFFLVDSTSNSISDTLFTALAPISLIITLAIFSAVLKGEKPAFGNENKTRKDYSPDNPKIYIILPFCSLAAAFYYLAFNQIFSSILFCIETLILYIIYREIVLSAQE